MMDGKKCIAIDREFHQIEIVDATHHLPGELVRLRIERCGDLMNFLEFLLRDIFVLE